VTLGSVHFIEMLLLPEVSSRAGPVFFIIYCPHRVQNFKTFVFDVENKQPVVVHFHSWVFAHVFQHW
jgi:hypothetical protein